MCHALRQARVFSAPRLACRVVYHVLCLATKPNCCQGVRTVSWQVADPRAAKCKEDLRCVYFSVNKGKSKGCSLKSTRRGSALSSTAYLGHGTCTHAVPPTCKVMETGKGDRNFMKNPLATFLSVINAVRCVLQGQACQLPMCSLATSCPAPAVA